MTPAFNAFSSADAYIRAARNGLDRATEQHLKDVQVNLLCPEYDNHMRVAPEN